MSPEEKRTSKTASPMDRELDALLTDFLDKEIGIPAESSELAPDLDQRLSDTLKEIGILQERTSQRPAKAPRVPNLPAEPLMPVAGKASDPFHPETVIDIDLPICTASAISAESPIEVDPITELDLAIRSVTSAEEKAKGSETQIVPSVPIPLQAVPKSKPDSAPVTFLDLCPQVPQPDYRMKNRSRASRKTLLVAGVAAAMMVTVAGYYLLNTSKSSSRQASPPSITEAADSSGETATPHRESSSNGPVAGPSSAPTQAGLPAPDVGTSERSPVSADSSQSLAPPVQRTSEVFSSAPGLQDSTRGRRVPPGGVESGPPTVRLAEKLTPETAAPEAQAPVPIKDISLGGKLLAQQLQPVLPPPVPGAVVKPASGVSPATVISTVRPAYPELARKIKLSGTVGVTILVDAEGRVTSAKAISGPAMLRQAAEEAVRRWRYKPASSNGANLPSQGTISIVFNNEH